MALNTIATVTLRIGIDADSLGEYVPRMYAAIEMLQGQAARRLKDPSGAHLAEFSPPLTVEALVIRRRAFFVESM